MSREYYEDIYETFLSIAKSDLKKTGTRFSLKKDWTQMGLCSFHYVSPLECHMNTKLSHEYGDYHINTETVL